MSRIDFDAILARAVERKGGRKALALLLPDMLSEKALAAIPDDRYLAAMTKVINQAGFSWKVIENKWPEFEAAFFGFDLMRLSLLSPEQWEAYCTDRRVVRNWTKIKTVRDNLTFVMEVARQHKSFAQFIAQWPCDDQVGLMRYLKKHASRLGGMSGPWFLRAMGKDGFVLSKDVVCALQNVGLTIADNPSSQRDLHAIQSFFNEWREHARLPYAHLSKIAAFSVGLNRVGVDA